MAFKRASQHTSGSRGKVMGGNFGNWTVGDYVNSIPVGKNTRGEWYLNTRRWHGACIAAKRRGIEVRYRRCEPFWKQTKNGGFMAKGYAIAADVKNHNVGYGIIGPYAMQALYAGVQHAKEMSHLIMQAYLK